MDIENGTYTYTGYGGQKCHVPIERVSLLSQLQKGDHIAIQRLRGCYWHHAIIEDVQTERAIVNVIEYSSYVKELLQDIMYRRSPGKAKVMRGNYRLEHGLYLIKHREFRPADTVVLSAISRLEESNYDLFSNNCEHFAMSCKTGISSSEQANNIKEMVKEGAKENGPPLIVGLVTEIGGEEIVRMLLGKNAQMAAVQAVTQSLSKGGQDMLLKGAEMAAEVAAMQVVAQSLSQGGQHMLLKGSPMVAAMQVLTQSSSKGGQEVLKKGAQMAAKQAVTQTTKKVVSQTSTTTGTSAGGSLMVGVVCGALLEGAIGLYDINCAKANLEAGNISQDEYNDAFRKRIVGSLANITGSTLGSFISPIPVVGSIVGGWLGRKVTRSLGYS